MKKSFALAALAAVVALPAVAQVKVGIITGATGPGASLGIPYKNTFSVVPKTLGGQPVQYIVMDDATDPTNAVKLARKLIAEDKVDLIIGSSSVPAATAITDVAAELKTPQIALSPVGAARRQEPVGVLDSPASQHHDGRRRRQHEGDRRQDRRLYRFLGFVGRPGAGWIEGRISTRTGSSWSPKSAMPAWTPALPVRY